MGSLSALDYNVHTDSYDVQTYVKPRCGMSPRMSGVYIHLTYYSHNAIESRNIQISSY